MSPTTAGTVQGSPLSPLRSNLVLDELDRELERRGLAFCRCADDCNSFVRTPNAAERVMASISGDSETRLKLVVNREQSPAMGSRQPEPIGSKVLGFTSVGEMIAIAHNAQQRARDKVKDLTPRGTHLRLEASSERINSWYVGWASDFALSNYPAQLRKIEAHSRRRLRSRWIDQQQNRRHRYRKLTTRGVPRRQAAAAVFSHRGRWALSNTRAVTQAYSHAWFIAVLGQATRADQKLPHWFDVDRWIRLA